MPLCTHWLARKECHSIHSFGWCCTRWVQYEARLGRCPKFGTRRESWKGGGTIPSSRAMCSPGVSPWSSPCRHAFSFMEMRKRMLHCGCLRCQAFELKDADLEWCSGKFEMKSRCEELGSLVSCYRLRYFGCEKGLAFPNSRLKYVLKSWKSLRHCETADRELAPVFLIGS